MTRSRTRNGLWIAVSALLGVLLTSGSLSAQRIMDVGRVEGVRPVLLKGPGLVIGLPGTGDSAKSAITWEMYGAFFENMGIPVPAEAIKSKNVALVMVTARVPSTIKSGSRIEITVSSIGDAKSLKGGWLLETPLGKAGRGVQGSEENPIVGIAQGAVEAMGETLTVGRGSGFLEMELEFDYVPTGDAFTVILDEPDFATASRVARAINDFPYLRYVVKDELPLAHAQDSGSVRVKIPKRFREPKQIVDFISRIMSEVQVPQIDRQARVIIDTKTGMVTVNGKVKVKTVVVLYGDAEIRIDGHDEPSQAPYLVDVINALRAQGITNEQMPAVIRNIHKAGALVGTLEER